MSKQSAAKAAQNYRENPQWPECRNCKHFKSFIATSGFSFETNLRCTLGNFAVKKLATCDKHETKK